MAIYRELAAQLAACGAAVDLGWQSCFGRCTQGPNVLVQEVTAADPPPRAFAAPPRRAVGATALYNRVTISRVAEIVRGHIVGGRVQRQLIERPPTVQSVPTGRPDKNGEP